MFIIFTEENSLLFVVFGIIYLSQCNTPGGGGTALFGLCGYVPLDRVWFLASLS